MTISHRDDIDGGSHASGATSRSKFDVDLVSIPDIEVIQDISPDSSLNFILDESDLHVF
jgi:hypothetical protein